MVEEKPFNFPKSQKGFKMIVSINKFQLYV